MVKEMVLKFRYCFPLLFIFLWWCTVAEAYQVNSYWTSAEGWGDQTTNFTTDTDTVFINVEASHIPEPINNQWMRMEWYRPDGVQESDLGTNLVAHPVRSNSGLLIGFWAEMAIRGMQRKTGQWRVEHYGYGWIDGVLDWHRLFTAYFTISPAPEIATYNATGRWQYATYNCWTDCPGDPEEPETGVVRVNQTGNSFTVTEEGETYSGSISGATYTYTISYPYDEGTVTLTTTFTLTSETTGSGVTTWNWTDGIDSCGGGNQFSITKLQVAGNPGAYLLLLDE
jgi:hypothetical protein